MPNLRNEALVDYVQSGPPRLGVLLSDVAMVEDWVVDDISDIHAMLVEAGDAFDEMPETVIGLTERPDTLRALRLSAAYANAFRRLVLLSWIARQQDGDLAIHRLLTQTQVSDDEERAALAVLREFIRTIQRNHLLAEIFSIERLTFICQALEE